MNFRLRFIQTSLLFGWLALSMVLFMLASRVSYLHIFSFPDQLTALSEQSLSIDFPVFLRDMIRALAGISLFTFSAFLFGALFFHWEEVSLAKLVTSFLVGEILFSLVFLSLITFSRLNSLISSTTILAGAVGGLLWIGIKFHFRPFSDLAHRWKHLSGAIRNQPYALAAALVILAASTLTSSRLGYDSVAYYFSHAKIMAITGRFTLFYPHTAFTVSDLHSTALLTAIIQCFGDQTARMLSWINGLAILLLGMAIGKKCGHSPRIQVFFAVLMLTSTAFVDLLGDGKLELISTTPLVAALWWMLDSLKNPSRSRFLLIGTLLGFAMIARPYDLFLVPVFTILFYLLQVLLILKQDGLSTALRRSLPVLWTFPTLLALIAFHLLQNWLLLGSPLAPFTYGRSLNVADWHWQFDPAILQILRLLYPFTVTFMNSPQSLGSISPLFAGILPFLLIQNIRARLKISTALRDLLLPALMTLVLWLAMFFTIVEIRYVFFLWVVFFLFTAQVIDALFDGLEKIFQPILKTALAVLLTFICAQTLIISLLTYSPIDSNGQAHCADLTLCTFLDPVNQTAAPGERIFVLNAYRYYLRPDLFACSSQAAEYAPLQSLAQLASGGFWAEIYRQGYSYVTFEKNFAEFHSRFGTIPPPSIAPEWLKITIVSKTPNETAYKIQAVNPPFQPVKKCAQENGIWRVSAVQP